MTNLLTATLLASTLVLGNDPGWIEPWQPLKDQTFSRPVIVDGHEYRVEYTWNPTYSTVPAVQGAQAHYSARITVYLDGKPINKNPILGTYVPGGCFEDVPAEWVAKALAQKDEPLKPAPNFFIGGIGYYFPTNSDSNLYYETAITNVVSFNSSNVVMRLDMDKIMKVVDDVLAKAREEIRKELEK